MKKSLFTFLILSLTLSAYCQTTSSVFNFDFENVKKGIPIGWSHMVDKDKVISIDSTTVRTGKYAGSIELKEGSPSYQAWMMTLPNNYHGKKITLSGYIKTDNVRDGYAGLWMRIDPSIAFDNMESEGIRGTTDWTKYEITLRMNPEKTKQIVLGGLLVGKGKMWLDDFKVTIDGKEIKNVKPFVKKELFPADKDHEFDKGSQINNLSLDKKQTENLKALGLIWGFLKYHHPNIAKGNYNWDYELFRILPKVLNAENQNSRDEILTKWIASLGEFSVGKTSIDKSTKIKIEPDLNWITSMAFSDELTSSLLNVKNAKRSNSNHYVRLHYVGNAHFTNENNYSDMTYPDAGFRVLALYRYWNMIQYYFPYKYLIEEDWKNVLEEFIPKVAKAKDKTEYTLSILELIARVHDTHAIIGGSNTVLYKYLGTNFAPVELEFAENKPVVKRYYAQKLGTESGLEIGDVITAVNNHPVEEIVKDKLKWTPASNFPTQLRQIAISLLRTNDSIINIEFIRNNKKENRTVKTFSTKEINAPINFAVKDSCFRFIDKDIAYLNNGTLKAKDISKIWKDIKNTKGLIIDIRNYPTGYPLPGLSMRLMPKRTTFAKFTRANIKTPGLFSFKSSMAVGYPNWWNYKGKVIILTNEQTQSAAEFNAMAYRVHPNATVIGSTTAGADGNVSQIYLPGGISTMISGIGVYYPDGKETQRIGIVPDIEIKPTIEGIKKGQDELMDKAIEIINRS